MLAALALVATPASAQLDGMSAWIAEANILLSSIRITAAQTNATAEKVTSSKTQAAQALASTQVDLFNREQIRKIWNDYGPTGQLVDGCFQVALADTTAQIKGRTDDNATRASSLVYSMSDDGKVAAPGLSGVLGGAVQRSSVPFAASVSKRVERHQQKYCSVSEAAAGYCTLQPNGMQAGDADFSLHFAPGQTYGWDQAEAAADFVKTVAPVKPMPAAIGCSDPMCLSALKARRAEEAYMSMSRFSLLRFVESRSTQATGEAKQAAGK